MQRRTSTSAPAIAFLGWICGLSGCGDAPPHTEGDGSTTPDRDGGRSIVQGPPAVPFEVEFGEVAQVTPETALPDTAALPHVTAYVEGETLRVNVFPIEGARDYRIYELPDDGAITDLGGGGFAVEQGTYRCAGMRYAPRVAADAEPYDGTYTAHTVVEGMVDGFARTRSDATLGYVSLTQESGTVPLYALGSPFRQNDNSCDGHIMHFAATRAKRYTTSTSDRDAMLSAGWRDDGILGYVPQNAGDGAIQILEQLERGGAPDAELGRTLYYGGAEQAARSGSPAFHVFAESGAGRQPLMRVHYDYVPCSNSPHDELVAGEARFELVYHQGPQPYANVAWSGVRARTRYVVEALDALCPYQGTVVSMESASGDDHEVMRRTEAQIREAAPHGEFFVNGQGDPANHPRAIARVILEAEPYENSVDAMAFHETFADDGLFAGLAVENGPYVDHWQNDQVFLSTIIFEWYSFGVAHDEFWFAFNETNGSNGKFRLTPRHTVELDDETFVHTTMSVDALAGDRRYPQILITDQNIGLPIQTSFGGDQQMLNGNTVIMQPFMLWPSRLDVEYCDHQYWDVNEQCPRYNNISMEVDGVEKYPPYRQLSEDANLGWRNRFDVFTSTQRVYVFVDYEPYTCALLPGSGLAPGPGHVTFGTVLYHAGAHPDVNSYDFYEFHNRYMIHATRRFFDDLGIEDGVAPPEWDEDVFPCTTELEE
jgi:hypothetical protein